jgi:hypothetical protein
MQLTCNVDQWRSHVDLEGSGIMLEDNSFRDATGRDGTNHSSKKPTLRFIPDSLRFFCLYIFFKILQKVSYGKILS